MKNLELFEIECSLEWLLKEQCSLLKQQEWIDNQLKHLDRRRAQLMEEKERIENEESK